MTASVDLAVRDAVTGDLTVLAESHRLAREAVSGARGGELDSLLRGRLEPIDESYARDLVDSDRTVRVGTVDGEIVGHCVACVQTLANGDRLCSILELWVHPDARAIGVGSAMMRDATAFAHANNCRGIDARALPGDRATKNFFESFGLVARSIDVHKSFR